MICVMINLNNYAEKLGKMIIIVFVLIDLKRGIKEDIVFVTKTKTQMLIVFRNRSLFKDDKCCIQMKTEMFWRK